MSDIALVTANFGAFDVVKALPDHEGVDAFYYTDEATRAGTPPGRFASWTQVLAPSYPRHDVGPRLRSRYFKQQIHRLDEVRRHRWLVWADSSMNFHELRFLHDLAERLRDLPPRQRLILVPHPCRRTIRQEYEFIRDHLALGDEYLRLRYAQEAMTEQMDDYHRRGWSLEARLYCSGFWMVENSDPLHRCWDDWWDHTLRFGMMDQLSLPVLLDEHGCAPQILDMDIFRNDHFCHLGHSRHG